MIVDSVAGWPPAVSAYPNRLVNISDLRTAAGVIHAGGIVAYPTESCYGLGCDPRRHQTVRRLLRIKRRHWRHGLILIAARPRQLARYIDRGETKALKRALDSWPGPRTWLMPARPGVSAWLTGGNAKVAVRITAHRGAAALCNYARLALVSTSANRHGRPAAKTVAAVHSEFADEVDYVLAGSLGGDAYPSEIRDAVSGELIRPGQGGKDNEWPSVQT